MVSTLKNLILLIAILAIAPVVTHAKVHKYTAEKDSFEGMYFSAVNKRPLVLC